MPEQKRERTRDELDKASHRQEWMDDDQWECALLLRSLFRGFHHMSPHRIKPCGPSGIKYYTRTSLATYDGFGLTLLVMLAHDRMFRAEIIGGTANYVGIALHKRHNREGGEQWDRHPTLEEHVKRLRLLVS
jgi:hypothetical protein